MKNQKNEKIYKKFMSEKKKKLVRKDEGFSKASIRRLARRAGCRRISSQMYETLRQDFRDYLEKIITTALAFCRHAKRKTISITDVLLAFKRHGKPMIMF